MAASETMVNIREDLDLDFDINQSTDEDVDHVESDQEISANEHCIDYSLLERVHTTRQSTRDSLHAVTTIGTQNTTQSSRESVHAIETQTTIETQSAATKRGPVPPPSQLRVHGDQFESSLRPSRRLHVLRGAHLGLRASTSSCRPQNMGPRITDLQQRSEGLSIEDITTVDPSTEFPSLQPRSRGRPTCFQQRRKPLKNGNWTDADLHAAITAHDSGFNMKEAASCYNIPYTSFREHLYGSRTSRVRGVKGVLTHDEERKLADYCIAMSERGHGLTPLNLRMKVSEITANRDTPFRNGIPGNGWMRGWKRRHPELCLRTSQGLEFARASALCKENVDTFYDNLERLYSVHGYPPEKVWNCDESGVQAGKKGGGLIIAKQGARPVHSLIPDQREWLSVLVCVNASGFAIPSFYIFRGKRFGANYIERCERGATMAMQPRAWMTTYLFSAWISHFIASIKRISTISPTERHLLILDGHNSHITLDVVQEAKSAGLDILTLPSHTSHALQPLDVCIFKPFKQYFREFRDFWTSRNLHQPASKQTLAQWVSLALKKALTANNIRSGVAATGILPLNRRVVDKHMAPSEAFVVPHGRSTTSLDADTGTEVQLPTRSTTSLDIADISTEAQLSTVDNTETNVGTEDQVLTVSMNRHTTAGTDIQRPTALDALPDVDIETELPSSLEEPCCEQESEEIVGGESAHIHEGDIIREFERQPSSQDEHFYVDSEHADPSVADEVVGYEQNGGENESITRFLTLPTVTQRSKPRNRDPILDFTKSIILTDREYIESATKLKAAKEHQAQEKEKRVVEKEEAKKRRLSEKEVARVARAAAREEAAKVRELRATQAAENQARRQAQREEAHLRRAERAAEAANAKAKKAVERAQRALERQEFQSTRAARVARSAHGHHELQESEEARVQEVHFKPPRQDSATLLPSPFPSALQLQSPLPHYYFHPPSAFTSRSAIHLPALQEYNVHVQSTLPPHPSETMRLQPPGVHHISSTFPYESGRFH